MFPLLMSCHTIFMLGNEITIFATEDVLGYFKVKVSFMLLHIELGAKVLVTLATRKPLFRPTFSNQMMLQVYGSLFTRENLITNLAGKTFLILPHQFYQARVYINLHVDYFQMHSKVVCTGKLFGAMVTLMNFGSL